MGEIKKILAKKDKMQPIMFRNRVVFEWCEDVHIHFRNLRLELKEDDFLQLASAFLMARHRLWQWYGFPKFMLLDIDQIEPYDEGHKKVNNEWGFDCGSNKKNLEHIQGIKYWLEQLEKGREVPPILVKYDDKKNNYKRMDGFKRFMAMKSFGMRKIPCIVDDNAIPGGQERITWHGGNGFTYNHVFSKREPIKSKGERFEILSEFKLEKEVPFEKRLQIELQKNNSVHLHYNNIRLEFEMLEYLRFAQQIIKSYIKIFFLALFYKILFESFVKKIADFIYVKYPKIFNIVYTVYRKCIKK